MYSVMIHFRLNQMLQLLIQPLLIGYGVFWLIVAPSGLWGIFGSTQDNTDLCNRYLRDHWFSSAVISTVDIIKIVFSFTMKDNSIQKCLNETPTGNCGKKVDFSQKAGLIAFGVQGFLMVGLGLLVWFSCRQLSKKKDEKAKVELGHGLETQNTRQLNDDDTINLRVEDRVETNPLSSFKDRRPSQYSKGQKGQNEQKIKKDNENVVRSREEQGSIKNANNNVQGFDQQQYTTPLRPRKSSDRQMTPSDELQGYPPQGMNQTAPVNRSKSMAPPVRSNSSRFPPPQPEYRFIPSIQPPQGVKGMQKSRAPIPPSFYYNRPPFPQYQQMSNFPPMYPWQQQWPGYNNRPIPPQGDFRGHRRSKSQPELRPLPFLPPSSRRSSTSSRRRSSVNDKRPYSQMHRTNSLPNLSNHEDLMRNEMLFAPPVPLIPSNLQSNTKNSNKDDKSDNKNTRESQPPIINNDDKLERFIKMYGDKEYNIQRPKSAQSVQGEASPKSSIYVEDGYYNDYYYGPPLGGPPLGYNNYVYPQYSGPIGYNNGENFVQSNPMNYNGGWVNYGQQRPQRMNYYY
ncbi:5301_t:CDS:2 [Rhizophagus irregularis]|nr:5301_t:CDS:2 [Rhizophagus irregularis]